MKSHCLKQFECTLDTFQAYLKRICFEFSFVLLGGAQHFSVQLGCRGILAWGIRTQRKTQVASLPVLSVICNLKICTRKRIILTLIMVIIIDFSVLGFCTCWTTALSPNCPIPNLITHYFCRLKNLTLN